MIYGSGLELCPGCGAQLQPSDTSMDPKGRRWQRTCFEKLRCELCGDAKARAGADLSRAECPDCRKKFKRWFDWIAIWRQIGEEAAMAIRFGTRQAEEQRRQWAYAEAARARDWVWAWRSIGAQFQVDERSRRRQQEARGAAWLLAWQGIGVEYARFSLWRRRWLKLWGRLGAHVRREHFRFVNRASFESDDPSVRRFARIEID